MGKRIKLTEQEFRNTVNRIVRQVLTEAAQPNINKLDDSFEMGLSQITDLYESLKGFIREYGSFVTSMIGVAEGLGLQLVNANVFNKFDLRTALKGGDYIFDFKFIVPGVDVEAMDDNEFDEFEKRLDNIARQFEYSLGNPEYGNVSLSVSENEINVAYKFNF